MPTTLTGWVVLAIVVGIVVLVVYQSEKGDKARRATLTKASNDYQVALVKLKASPTDPDLKRRALELGRAYAALTRQQKAVTVFDEVALSNDISAASAAASVQAAPAPAQVPVKERLAKLDELRTAGMITEQEYTQRRQKILDEL